MKLGLQFQALPEVKSDLESSAYTPHKTVKYEKHIKASYRSVSNTMISEKSPIEIEILAFFAVPKSTSKKDKNRMLLGEILPTKKHDSDNAIKIVLDALNGVAYADDKQICDVKFKKIYGEKPRLEIKIKQIMEEQSDEKNQYFRR